MTQMYNNQYYSEGMYSMYIKDDSNSSVLTEKNDITYYSSK